jgi:TPP-dependent pyruvate/acetoin dehydrogenase alpha subunit
MTAKSKEISPAVFAPPSQNGFSLITNEKLLALYAAMVKCRLLQERAQSAYEGLGAGGDSTGQEAAAAGVLIDLGAEDTLAACSHGLMTRFLKGEALDGLFGELNGRAAGTARRVRAGRTQIATQLKAGLRAARAHKKEKRNKVAVAFGCASADAQEHWQEALRVAGEKGLPIIFVRLGVDGPGKGKKGKANGHGVPHVHVDGNDAVAVYRVASEAIAHARKGNGATLIECIPFRLAGVESGQSGCEGDPLLNMEKYLRRKGLFKPEFKAEVAAGFGREIQKAVEAGTLVV